jgi:hypothetical protein
MAEGLLFCWVVGIWGYLAGLTVHIIQVYRYRRYLPSALRRRVVLQWIFDETNRAIVKAILAVWGVARIEIVFQRPYVESVSPTVLNLDLLTLALYWGLLLQFTYWTWHVRRLRARDPEPYTG